MVWDFFFKYQRNKGIVTVIQMRLITCILCNEKKVFNTQNAPVLNGVKITISHLPCKHLVRDADPISSLGEVLMMELD